MAFKSTQVVSCIVSQLAVKITGRPLSWPSFTLIYNYFFIEENKKKWYQNDILSGCNPCLVSYMSEIYAIYIYSLAFYGFLSSIPNPIREWMNNGWLKIEMLVQYMFFLPWHVLILFLIFLEWFIASCFFFWDRMVHCCLIILRSSDSALICAHGPIRYIYLFIPQ